MKTMKKVLAFMLALAMVVTAVPVANAEAATTGFKKSKVNYYAGKTYTLEIKTPSSWKSVSTKWDATNNNTKAVAISNKKTKSVTVKALKKGKAVVTAKVTYKKGGVKTTKTYKCNVRVKAPTIAITQKEIKVEVDKTANITAKYVPASATVSFESEDSDIAAVKDLGNGKAVVTGVMPGQSTNIKAYLRCGKKVKMSIVKVTVTGEPLEDGLSAKLRNEFTGYENTVVYGSADLRFYYGKGGKGLDEKSIVVTLKKDGSAVPAATKYTRTDANGYAFVTFNGLGFANYTYEAKVEATGETFTGKIVSARLGVGDIQNVNGQKKAIDGKDYVALGYGDIVVAENDYKGTIPGDKVVSVSNVWSSDLVDTLDNKYCTYDVDVVPSQQVSTKGTAEHKVGFIGGLPYIEFPGNDDTLNQIEPFEIPVGETLGAYATNDLATTVDIKITDANELVNATLCMKDLKLSKYTRLEIQTFNNIAFTGAPVNVEKVYGATDQAEFKYQIPLQNLAKTEIGVRVKIIAKGQVNTDAAKGVVVDKVVGQRRPKTVNTDYKWEYLKDAKVTWEKIDPVFTGEVNFNAAGYNLADKADVTVGATDTATKKQIQKVTIKVPVFPQTGNAVITTYDKNGKVIAYFALPTENNKFNQNVPSTTAKYLYRISEEEANHSVGTVTQDGYLVTVDSEVSGVTRLRGVIEGYGVSADAARNVVYTSVQWNPIVNGTATATGAIALAGQEVKLTAQLIDKNGNIVSNANEPITFSSKDTNAITVATKLGTNGTLKADVLKVDANTNSKGQAEIILTAENVNTVVENIAASTKRYNVVMLVDGVRAEMVDLYFVNARPAFYPTASNEPAGWEDQVTTAPVVEKLSNPSVGENWEFAFALANETLPNIGVWKNKVVTPKNIKIAVTPEPGNKATINAVASKNGTVTAYSTIAHLSTLKANVNGTPFSADGISFDVAGVGNKKCVGYGESAINNDQKLEVQWTRNGSTGKFVSATGAVATTGSLFTLYFSVQDMFGNADKDMKVDVKSSLGIGAIDVVSGGNPFGSFADVSATHPVADGVFEDVVADVNGIITVVIDPTTRRAGQREVISVVMDGETYTQNIIWKAPEQLALDLNPVDATRGVSSTNPYRTYADTEKIVLTFNQDINPATLIPDQFTVGRWNGTKFVKVEIASVSAAGKVITLTLKNKVADGYDLPYAVVIQDKKIDSVNYSVTTTDGARLVKALQGIYGNNNNGAVRGGTSDEDVFVAVVGGATTTAPHFFGFVGGGTNVYTDLDGVNGTAAGYAANGALVDLYK